MKKISMLLVLLALVLSGCLAPTNPKPTTDTGEPTQPIYTSTPPTVTPTVNPIRTENIKSFSDSSWGSFAGFFEDREKQEICKNPFVSGYPREENGNWVFRFNDGAQGWILKKVENSTETNTASFLLESENPKYKFLIKTQVGGLVTLWFPVLDQNGCVGTFNHKTGVYVEPMYSPTTDDFVYTFCGEGAFIEGVGNVPQPHLYCPDIVRDTPWFYVDDHSVYPTDGPRPFRQECESSTIRGRDYMSYVLPHGDGTEYFWGGKSGCMTATVEFVEQTP